MRRILILYVLIQTNHLFSQTTWIGSGASWHYNFEELSGTSLAGFFKYSYTGDTLIEGINCQKIQRKIYEFITYPSVEFYDSSSIEEYYTYVSNDTVYYRNYGQFFVLFDFGASIGDSWIISTTHNGDAFCNDTSIVTVVDTSSIIMNGQAYRTLELESVDGSSYGLWGTYNEKFGLINGFSPWHLFPRANVCDSGIIVEWFYMSFKCYEDDLCTLYNPSDDDCEYLLTHLDLEKENSIELEIWPNPVDELLSFRAQEKGSLIILSISGREAAHLEIETGYNEINISSLETGSYLFVFTSDSGSTSRKLIVKN